MHNGRQMLPRKRHMFSASAIYVHRECLSISRTVSSAMISLAISSFTKSGEECLLSHSALGRPWKLSHDLLCPLLLYRNMKLIQWPSHPQSKDSFNPNKALLGANFALYGAYMERPHSRQQVSTTQERCRRLCAGLLLKGVGTMEHPYDGHQGQNRFKALARESRWPKVNQIETVVMSPVPNMPKV